jgi:hypothetical protein
MRANHRDFIDDQARLIRHTRALAFFDHPSLHLPSGEVQARVL